MPRIAIPRFVHVDGWRHHPQQASRCRLACHIHSVSCSYMQREVLTIRYLRLVIDRILVYIIYDYRIDWFAIHSSCSIHRHHTVFIGNLILSWKRCVHCDFLVCTKIKKRSLSFHNITERLNSQLRGIADKE